MKKDNFNKIFVGVLILHIIFIYIIPGFEKIIIKTPKVKKIAIGITTQNEDSAPKKIEKKEEIKEVEKKETPKKEVPKKEIPKEVVKKVETKPLLETTQSFDDLDLLAVEESDRTISTKSKESKSKETKPHVEKEIVINKERKINDLAEDEDIKIPENLVEVEPDLDIQDDDVKEIKVTENQEALDDIKWENITADEEPSVVGPKSGVKYGALDGKSKVIWDPSNKEPVYPLEAEKKAQTADVKIILDVDSSGKVLKVKIIKTGVDVIDRAVESIARDWNIKLISNGMAIDGSVEVTYQFKLKGRE